MHEIPADAETKLRGLGLTDRDLQTLRSTGAFHRQDGTTSLVVGVQGGRVSIMNGATGTPTELAAMQRQAIGQAEHMVGMDLDGDGVIGTSDTTSTRAASASTPRQSAQVTGGASNSPGPFIGGEASTSRNSSSISKRLIFAFFACDVVVGLAIVVYFLTK